MNGLCHAVTVNDMPAQPNVANEFVDLTLLSLSASVGVHRYLAGVGEALVLDTPLLNLTIRAQPPMTDPESGYNR